jgi:hypothetical protein
MFANGNNGEIAVGEIFERYRGSILGRVSDSTPRAVILLPGGDAWPPRLLNGT